MEGRTFHKGRWACVEFLGRCVALSGKRMACLAQEGADSRSRVLGGAAEGGRGWLVLSLTGPGEDFVFYPKSVRNHWRMLERRVT